MGQQIDVMMKEYESVTQGVKLLGNAIIRDFQIFLAFVGALLAFGAKTEASVQFVFAITPGLIFGFSLFFLMKATQMDYQAAYVAYIEKEINHSVGRPALNWESVMSPSLLYSARSSFFWCTLVFSLALLGAYIATAVMGYQYFCYYAHWARLLYFVSDCICGFGCLVLP